MGERIYNRNELGRLEPMEEVPFAQEDELQELIANHPELLDGEQMRPGAPRRWILVAREQGVAETSDSAYRWALDHLIIDQDATPTLVEVKRGSNSEIRRTIVGQMLDYAAHGSQTLTADQLRQAFEARSRAREQDPDEELRVLLGERSDGAGSWKDDFWQGVATNLAAKRLRLLFVADKIPDELTRVVEFLNEQMPNIEVLAVEIKQFRGKTTQTLVPRVLGRTAATSSRSAAGPRSRITRQEFQDDFDDAEQRAAASRLLDVADGSGAAFNWDSAGVSIRARCPRWHLPISVAWLYSPSKKGFSERFNFGVISSHYGTEDETLGAILKGWVDQFADDEFSQPLSRRDMRAYVIGYDEATRNIDLLAERLAKVLQDLKSCT